MTLNILYGFCTPGTKMCKVAEMGIGRRQCLRRLEELSDISDENAMSYSDFWTWFVATFDDAVDGWEDYDEQADAQPRVVLIRDHPR